MDMTYSVGSRILKTFQQFLQYYEASSLACGVLIVKANLNHEWIQKLKDDMAQKEPEACAQFTFDSSEGLLGILLDDSHLSYTHSYSRHVKGFLEENNLLTGTLLIGSFPENGHQAEQMMFSMIWQQMVNEQDEKEIHIFNKSTGVRLTSTV